ncbi:MAG TPA: serine/threonine-protein kinase [Vicinamibacterales bacterium]|nr:serine/threonine-protein kinase [Vicinamibacterales bacterium]
MVGQNIGKYRVLERVGRGGMGTVYRSIDETLHREVAIKVLNAELNDPEVAKRFRAEAITVARLSHPGIATIYELFQHEGQWLMVMEFVRGETIEHMVERMGPLSPQRSAEISMQALAALAHAHSMGVVHRDLKPANIMITETGSIKIMDFGIARVAGTEHLTSAGFMMGTPAYMAPEQVLGHEIDARADLYAMGVVFYRLSTAKLPFKGDTPFAMAQSQVNDPPTPIGTVRADLPPWVEQVVVRALAKNPEERFQSAIEFHEAFARCLAGLPMATMYNSSAPTELMVTPSRAMPTGTLRTGTPPASAAPMSAAPVSGAMPLEGAPTVASGLTPVNLEAASAASGAVPAATGTGVTSPPVPVVPASPVLPAAAPHAAPAHAAASAGSAKKKSNSTLVIAAALAGLVVILAIAGGLWLRSRRAAQAAADAAAAAATTTGTPAAGAPVPDVPIPEPQPLPGTPAAAAATPPTPAPPVSAPPSSSEPATAPAAVPATDAMAARETPATGTRAGGPAASAGAAAAAGRGAAPVDDAPQIVADAKVLHVTGNKSDDEDALINFASGQISFVSKKTGSALGAIPYKGLVHATYIHARDPRWDASLPGPPKDLDVGGILRTPKDWLVLQTASSYHVLRLDSSNWQRALELVEQRTGVRVDRQKSSDN